MYEQITEDAISNFCYTGTTAHGTDTLRCYHMAATTKPCTAALEVPGSLRRGVLMLALPAIGEQVLNTLYWARQHIFGWIYESSDVYKAWL